MSYINPRSKVLNHIDKIAQLRRMGTTLAPVNVEIDLSNRCSHGCSWCHFAYTHTKGPLAGKRDKPSGAVLGGDLMSIELAYDILRQLKAEGVKSVTWTGGGEPTLHPHFTDIIEFAATLGLDQGLYTHGGHITPALADALREHLTFVYVSLDECSPEAFKRSKGVARFGNVLSGINNLVTAKGDATVGVGFLLHEGNYSDIDAMVGLGRELGVDYVQFRPIIDYDQAAPGQLKADTAWISEAVYRLGFYEDDPFVIADAWRFNMYQGWTGHGYPTCNWAAMQTVITPNGKVWRCLNKREHPDALLGDLSTESFMNVWRRAGGPCAVNGGCRVMCRGHIANITLDAVLTEQEHRNFI